MGAMSVVGMALPMVFRFENIVGAVYSGAMNVYLKSFLFSRELLILFSYILLLTMISSGITIYAVILSLTRGLKLKIR